MPYDPECRRCSLCQGRIRVVPPTGALRSNVALVGEAPGAKENEVGRPFVGRAGKILDGLMSEAGLDRGSVMITNTVKCRPPENRRPTAEEMMACRPYLEDELEGKEFVLALGLSAAEDLLGHKMVMKDVANKVFEMEVRGKPMKIMVTYHPSACIYRPPARDVLRQALKDASAYL
jgi:uracil-DNA glycosylase